MACLSVFTAVSKQRYVPDPPHQRGHLSFPSSSCIYVPHLEMISHAHQLKQSMVRSWSSLGSSWARQSHQRPSSPSWRQPWQVFNLHLSLMLPQQWHRLSSLTTYWPPHVFLSAEMATMDLFKLPGMDHTGFFSGPATFSVSKWAPEKRLSAPTGLRRRTWGVAHQMESHVGAVGPRKSV